MNRPPAISTGYPIPVDRQGGFTLTELAVVLVIVALLIGGMLVPLSAQQDIRARQETEKTLLEVQEALYGFAAANGRLPCPATDVSNGKSSPENPTAVTPCTCVQPNCFVPAATLVITHINAAGQAVDGWNNPIRYAVTSANSSAFVITDALKPIWGTAAPPNPNLNVCPDSACAAKLTETAVAVVWSSGQNASSGGTSADEKENPNPNTAANPDPTADRFVSHSPGNDFDDLLLWLSPNVLYNRMITAGRLP